MNQSVYKQMVNKAFNCGTAKYPVMKTQNTLIEQFGKNLDPPKGYQGLTIMEAYMQGYNK